MTEWWWGAPFQGIFFLNKYIWSRLIFSSFRTQVF